MVERGTQFGYSDLVVDPRNLSWMRKSGGLVTADVTHSLQQPGGQGEVSGGQREFVPVLARAALAIGVGAVFMETHEDPDSAPSDGPNMVHLKELPGILATLVEIDRIAKANPVEI